MKNDGASTSDRSQEIEPAVVVVKRSKDSISLGGGTPDNVQQIASPFAQASEDAERSHTINDQPEQVLFA